MNIKALRGVSDILPAEVEKWQFIEEVAREVFGLYGYQEVRTPIIEEADLFKRSIGETTDIVEKQMYTFQDRGRRRVSLRPEATASVVRAYLEHTFDKKRGFTKFYYIGPMFRSERPQKGRMRQFHQLGVEAIGSYSPYLDGEIISLAVNLLKRIGITQSVVRINSLGCRKDKQRMAKELRENLQKRLSSLCGDCQQRFSHNVFRVLDCKNEKCRRLMHKLPPISDSLCSECSDHFRAVKESLKTLGIEYMIDPYLVRGLDYYTRTAFELTHPALGSKDATGAGGRYDNLVSDMNGPEVGAVGFALGIERLIIALSASSQTEDKRSFSPEIYIVAVGAKDYRAAFKAAHLLRDNGITTEIDYLGRSLKGQMRAANRNGVRWVMIFGDEETKRGMVSVKDMKTGKQEEIDKDSFVEKMKEKLQDR